jgi:hypothetical protein
VPSISQSGVQSQSLHRFESQRTARSVAGVDRETNVAPAELNVCRGLLYVGRRRVDRRECSPWGAMEALGLHDGAELDDVVAVQRAFAHHHLESIFVGRVVAAGDLNPAV